MAGCRVSIDDHKRITFWVGDQRLSRISYTEARDLTLQLLIFAGREFRDDIANWINKGKVQDIADVIAPEERPQ